MNVKLKNFAISGCCLALAGIITASCITFLGKPLPKDKGFDKGNNGYDLNSAEVDRLISVKPTPLQEKFSDLEYYSFIHYGMNTFTGVEWGTGKESPSEFNPKNVDTDQWARVISESGSKGIIFTAKHHDGFCLFQTKYTEHSIKNSPYKNGKGDIVAELAKSCKKYGLKLGIYLSPWDMHESTYGTDAYNDYFVNQLTELCTNYGDIFAFWFDGARGENVPEFEYDFDRYYKVIRRLQPNAVIANCGPDVRWIGNEAGVARESEWSVITDGDAAIKNTMNNSQKNETDAKKLSAVSHEASDIGSRELVMKYQNLVWYPAEADVSIHRGWFYSEKGHPSKMRSAKALTDIYFKTVGGNASLLMNVPPSKNGVIEEKDVKLLSKFKSSIDKTFENKLDYTVTANENETTDLDKIKATNSSYMLKNGESTLTFKFSQKSPIRTIVLREDISKSQRVEAFEVYVKTLGGYKKVSSDTVIGSKKIIRLKFPKVFKTNEVKIIFTQSRSNPVIRSIEFYS